jgi:hypothetical protein
MITSSTRYEQDPSNWKGQEEMSTVDAAGRCYHDCRWVHTSYIHNLGHGTRDIISYIWHWENPHVLYVPCLKSLTASNCFDDIQRSRIDRWVSASSMYKKAWALFISTLKSSRHWSFFTFLYFCSAQARSYNWWKMVAKHGGAGLSTNGALSFACPLIGIRDGKENGTLST